MEISPIVSTKAGIRTQLISRNGEEVPIHDSNHARIPRVYALIEISLRRCCNVVSVSPEKSKFPKEGSKFFTLDFSEPFRLLVGSGSGFISS